MVADIQFKVKIEIFRAKKLGKNIDSIFLGFQGKKINVL